MMFRIDSGGNVKVALLLAFLAATPAVLRADVKLPRIFTDHMVLQQKQPIVVWGKADAGEQVSVSLDANRATATAGADGKWDIELTAIAADGKPLELVVKGKNTVTLKDVLLGEVWLCSGQSNMGRPVEEPAIKAAEFPQIRLFNSSGQTPAPRRSRRPLGLDRVFASVHQDCGRFAGTQ